jgi:hypothetical protein
VIAFVPPGRPALANPSPCRDHSVAGRHIYVTAPQTDVHIRSERLRFNVQRPDDRHAIVEVDVAYVLDNRGGARDLVIGFPVNDIDVSAFRISGDGVGKRVVPSAGEASDWLGKAGLSECEGELSDASEVLATYRWFLWQQSLRPGTSRLHVRYLLRWMAGITDELVVDYVLRTTRNWGDGRIGRLDIELRDPTRPYGQHWKALPKPTEVLNHGRLLRWSFASYRPVRDLQLKLESPSEFE